MSLTDYNKKRSFKDTPEPEGELSYENAKRFVVQRHQASHLHYDLRLEMDGVLKSWAIPKGPSMNPKDKRLAIRTEDHPVKYLSFHGQIPKGNYGAGFMSIWDEGTYTISDGAETEMLEQLEKGDLKISFFGKKLKGNFALVTIHSSKEKKEWLLIKKKDDYATDLHYEAEMYAPKQDRENANKTSKKSIKVIELTPKKLVKPMLATQGKQIFNDPDWIFEIKWDGYRILANIQDGEVDLYSRNGISYNAVFTPIQMELQSIPHDVILDGEVVILDKNGLPVFQKLQNYDPNTSKDTLRYYVFDLLFLNGHDMQGLSLLERKSLLPEVLEDLDFVQYCDHVETMGITFYDRAIDLGLEGVIAKKADSVYTPGIRTEHWLKFKAVQTTEAIICGYTEANNGGGLFGSLILGMYIDTGLTYVGNCGSGFSNDEQKELLEIFKNHKSETNPFGKKINLKGRKPIWMRPELICEVKFSEWTKNNRMRHPVFKSLRNDKVVNRISKEDKTNLSEPSKEIVSSQTESTLNIHGINVPVSNLDKVYFPESGIRKYDIIDYYIKISDTLLKYQMDRPQNLHRHPNGIQAESFYQKDNEFIPDWIKTINIYSKSAEKNIHYLLCQNEATLVYMANLGCIEINPWNSKIGQLDHPDYTVIDLDPSKTNTFDEVIETAQAAKEVLDMAKIKGFCKTSGSSGLHIYIPLAAQYTYNEARDFTKLLCYYIHEKLPKLTSMERAVKARKGKIYLDYLQNRRGQTLASAYCVRPKKGASVSTPLSWKEVRDGLKISDFNIYTVPPRLASNGDWFSPVLEKGIDMNKALQHLNEAVNNT